jgi:putative DNA primase/helicase
MRDKRQFPRLVSPPGATSQVPLPSPAAGSTGTNADHLDLVPFSEDALAALFGDRYKHEFRFVDRWGRWLWYDGHVWREDVTRKVISLIRSICRHESSKINDDDNRDRRTLNASHTFNAVQTICRSDRRLVAITEQWDEDTWGLNTRAGMVDLRTGELQDHHFEQFATKITSVSPMPECPIEVFLRFLERITDKNLELQKFLQRMGGYCLTGQTSEHALFFLYGTGANGKSTFLNVLTGIMADYCRSAPMETFVATSGDRHPTDMAGLRGARLVTATETQEGRRWDEAKVKALTGGDAISARFMRQDFFDFKPQFKLVVSGNHKPSIRSVDEAIRRRFHLVPFTVTIPPNERDPDLGKKLEHEWPGILHWLIEGCLEWQRTGLAPPPVVRQATEEYLMAEDSTQAWMDDVGTRDVNAWEPSADLWMSWESWAKRSGEHVGSRKQFAQALDRVGLAPGRSSDWKQRGYRGLRLTRG